MISRVLLLAGTAEARRLARVLAHRQGLRVVSSLAGRVRTPNLPAGEVRLGGFGGADSLVRWLRTERVDVLVDATHPFAAAIT
ncbi:MAG: precorrin-6A/cobalt-precorrin-6A reductase, partial [Sciscionella sp.]